MKYGLGSRVAGILWGFLNLHSKFLIISLSEDADLRFKKYRVFWNKYYYKKYEQFLKVFLLYGIICNAF